MIKKLHPRIQSLKDRTSGEYLTCRYVNDKGEPIEVDNKMVVDESDDRVIKGYLAVFGIKDSYGTRAIKGCFAKSLKDRGPESGAKNKIIHLWFHRIDEPIGQYRVLKEDDYGLYFECVVDNTPGTPERALIQTRSGTLNQFSYGFDYVWDKMEYNQGLDAVDMFECDLFEGTSCAVKAANPETYAIRTKEDFAKKLIELGTEAEELIKTLNRKQQMEIRQIITGYKSLTEFKPIQGGPLDLSGEPINGVMAVGEYKLNLNQFKV